jgi:hypothetical protein
VQDLCLAELFAKRLLIRKITGIFSRLVSQTAHESDESVRDNLPGRLCRKTSHLKIVGR